MKGIPESDRKFIFRGLLIFILLSLIGLFVASFVYEKRIVLQDMSNWTSFILGIVAIIVGMISLFLSFYNVDKAQDSQEKTIKVMNDLRDKIIDEVGKIPEKTTNMVDTKMSSTVAKSNYYNDIIHPGYYRYKEYIKEKK